MSHLWFKAKRYGWGWYPVTWQGWVTVLAFIVLALGNALTIEEGETPSPLFFVRIVILVTGLILICYKKGEKPRWRWE